MSAIVKATGYGGNTIPGMQIGVSESRQRSKMYWGSDIDEAIRSSTFRQSRKPALNIWSEPLKPIPEQR